MAIGDGSVLDHGNVEHVARKLRFEIAFHAAPHSFENNQVGVGSGDVQGGVDVGEIDEGLARSGTDALDG